MEEAHERDLTIIKNITGFYYLQSKKVSFKNDRLAFELLFELFMLAKCPMFADRSCCLLLFAVLELNGYELQYLVSELINSKIESCLEEKKILIELGVPLVLSRIIGNYLSFLYVDELCSVVVGRRKFAPVLDGILTSRRRREEYKSTRTIWFRRKDLVVYPASDED